MPLLLAYDQSNAGEDEVLIHYLEWQTSQITQDPVYTAWPESSSTVQVVNNQTDYLRNTFPDFWYMDGSTTKSVSGKDIWGCDTPYEGPNPSDMNYILGYGKLTGGHLDGMKGDKTFGTLGQGTEDQNYMYGGGAVDTWNYDYNNYRMMSLTFIPAVDKTASNK